MSNFTVNFTKKAEKDLASILSYIARDNIDNAINLVGKLAEQITETLCVLPTSGKLYGKLRGHNIRTLVLHKHYTAFYLVLEEREQVEVVAIFHSRQNEQKFWRQLKKQGIYKFPS